MIYLDNNATTAVDPKVAEAVFSSLLNDVGNPSSVHLPGRKTKKTIDDSRAAIADFLGCSPEEIFFTSGGTESNNLAILGVPRPEKGGHVITSAIEHPSVANPCRALERSGVEVTFIRPETNGAIDADRVMEAVREDTYLISVMHSNNETGVLQPVEEIGKTAEERGIVFHSDAAQTVGKMQFGLSGTNIDLLTVVSHKFYGPKGVGVLYVKKGIVLRPLLYGADHERGLRPGTENTAAIAGLAEACRQAAAETQKRAAHTEHLVNLLYERLSAALPGVKINGTGAKRLPNTLNLVIPGVRAVQLVSALKDEVAISSGSACHAGKDSPSAVLKSMGLTDEEALSSVRISAGKDNSEEEMLPAASLISEKAKQLRASPSFS